MVKAPKFSDELDDLSLAVLLACHRLGARRVEELSLQLDRARLEPTLARLCTTKHLVQKGPHFEISQYGRERLDRVLEALERALTPGSPALERRYRHEQRTLPFATSSRWAEAICANLRLPAAALRPLIPSAFELDLYKGEAWVSLTASRLADFGLGTLPSALRVNFYQSTYRAHVRYTDRLGVTRRGCYFLRSETNSAMMSLAANLMPEFRDHRCQHSAIAMLRRGQHLVLTVDPSDGVAGKTVLVLHTGVDPAKLPSSSRFPSLEEAYRFIVDFHEAFAFDQQNNQVLMLRIERDEWPIKVVQPVDSYFGLFDSGPLRGCGAQLDSVFHFTDVNYRWLPLVKEQSVPEQDGV